MAWNIGRVNLPVLGVLLAGMIGGNKNHTPGQVPFAGVPECRCAAAGDRRPRFSRQAFKTSTKAILPRATMTRFP